MVATEDGDALRVANLESDEQRHRFDREVAAVDIVAYKGTCQQNENADMVRAGRAHP